MSVSALPEWKQLLLERKRREEEERERREREEEARLASMPAWKRGIIQRRRAKQESGGERRESEREGGQHSLADGLCDDRLMPRQTDAENETTSKKHNWVSTETIGPIRQNPFIRSQNSYRRDTRRRDTERERHGSEKERESTYEKTSGEENEEKEESQVQERDFWRGRDREARMERTRDMSEGREKVLTEVWKDREKDTVRESREAERDGACLHLVPGLRTIKAENIIIIEKDSKSSEREAQREKAEREEAAEEEEKKAKRMDLREFLAIGASVTEIRASEVLIIKPSLMEEKTGEERKGEGERGSERKSSKESVTMSEKEKTKEGGMGKERERDQDRLLKEAVDSCKESSLGGGRVSQILSKFGQQSKPPCRSKSTDSFKDTSRVTPHCGTEEKRIECTHDVGFRGVPKRSFSFSERVVCICEERKVVERTYSDRRPPPPLGISIEQHQGADMSLRAQGRVSNEQQTVMQRKREIEREIEEKRAQEREEGKEKERKDQGSMEANGEVFSVASVRKPEGISFARRIPIRQDRRETKRFKEENERARTTEKEEMWTEIPDTGRHTEFHIEEKAEAVTFRRDREEVTVVMESVKSLCSYTLDSHDCSKPHAASNQKAVCVARSLPGTKPKEGDATTDLYKHENQPKQTAFPQHSEELLCEARRKPEVKANSDSEWRESDLPGGKEREQSTVWHEQEENRGMGNTCIYRPALLKKADEVEPMTSPKHTSWMAGVVPQEIRIPRSVFFGVDELAEAGKPGTSVEDGPAGGGGGKGVERRESWKAGKPLTRVESLREKIRQREMERQRRGEAEGEGESEAGRSEGEGMERGGERTREAEGALRALAVNRQEVVLPQTLSLFDVTKEASVSRAGLQHPASVPLSLPQPLSAGRGAPKLSGDGQRHPEQHEEDFGSQQDPDSVTAVPQEGPEEDLLEEEYVCPSDSPSPPSSLSPPPSPPLPLSLAAMSRIYNLKTVGSRTAVCISERNSDMPTHSRKVFPEGRFTQLSHPGAQVTSVCPQDQGTSGSNRTLRDGQPVLTTETPAVQSVQRQVEQLQLREQEVRTTSQGDGEAQCGPKKDIGGRIAQGQKRPDTQPEAQKAPTPTSTSRASPSLQTGPRVQSKLPQPKSFTINSRNASSPENLQKPHPSSPSSSVSLSPALSPAASQSSPLFSIRSASDRQGKRGTTITITPRRPAAAVSASPTSPSASPSTPQPPAPEPGTAEGRKKRYPTAEEIEVIGGYQNLENSCLVKNKGTPKREKVRFDETQLERVCEYPSEDSVLASLPSAGDDQATNEGRRVEGESDGQEEEEEEELVGFVSGGSRSAGTSSGSARVIRVDESCRR